jgi:hypothetical protein
LSGASVARRLSEARPINVDHGGRLVEEEGEEIK